MGHQSAFSPNRTADRFRGFSLSGVVKQQIYIINNSPLFSQYFLLIDIFQEQSYFLKRHSICLKKDIISKYR